MADRIAQAAQREAESLAQLFTAYDAIVLVLLGDPEGSHRSAPTPCESLNIIQIAKQALWMAEAHMAVAAELSCGEGDQ